MPKVKCPRCEKENIYGREAVGTRVRCQKAGCGKEFTIRASAGGRPARPKLVPPGNFRPSLDALNPGDLFLDRFLISRLAGRGTFGAVYLAYDTEEVRDVALKIPHPAVQLDDHFMKRFAMEASSLREMVHPNIVRFFEAHLDFAPAYLVTEFIEGGSLEEELSKAEALGGFGVERAVRFVVKLARALQHAHRHRVVHRDLKPSNVLVVGNEPKLTDFGLARLGDPSLSLEGVRIGTPYYMSPEQVRGDRALVGAASDQYSLGVLLYEMICGRVPFLEATAEDVYRRILGGNPPRPRSIVPTLPAAIERICLVALARNPDERWKDCAQFASKLADWLGNHGPVTAELGDDVSIESLPDLGPDAAIPLGDDPDRTRLDGAPKAIVRAGHGYGDVRRGSSIPTPEAVIESMRNASAALGPWMRLFARLSLRARGWLRRRLPAAIEVGKRTVSERFERLSDSLLRDESPSYPSAARPEDEDDVPPAFASSSPPNSATTPAAAASDAGTQAYLWHIERAHATWKGGDLKEARVQLDRCPVASRGLEWSYLGALLHSNFRPLSGVPGDVTAVTCDPSGVALGAIAGDRVLLWDTCSPQRRHPVGGHSTGRLVALAFSPDGQYVAAATGYLVRVWDARAGTEIRSFPSEASVKGLGFTPENRLAVAAGDGTIRLWAVSGAGDPLVISTGRSAVRALAMHGDGVRLVACCGDGSLQLWDWGSCRRLACVEEADGPTLAAFHPDGRTLATATRRRTLQFRGADDLRGLASVEAHTGDVTALAYHPNGRWIVSTGDDRVLRIGDAQFDPGATAQRLGAEAARIPLAGPPASSLAIDAEGRVVLGGGRLARIWDPPAFWSALGAGAPPEAFRSVAAEPSGGRLAHVSWGGAITLTGGDGDEVGTRLEPASSAVHAIAFWPGQPVLATAEDDGTIRLRRMEEGGAVLRAIPAHDGPARGVAFRADGRLLATAGLDGSVRLWDPEAGAHIRAFSGHAPRGAIAVAFFPGQGPSRIISGGDDRIIRVWDEQEDDPVLELIGHERSVIAVAASRDGRRISSLSMDRTLRIWSARDGRPLLNLTGLDILPSVCHSGSGTFAAVGEDHAPIIGGPGGAAHQSQLQPGSASRTS